MKRIEFNPRFFYISIIIILFVSNSLLYILRNISDFWWAGDSQVFAGTSSALHFNAYLSFLIFLFVFSLASSLLLKNLEWKDNKNHKLLSILCVLLFSFQIYAAIFFGVGVASQTGSVENPLFYFLMIFSLDALYVVYAIKEKSKKRLFVVSAFFVFSNVVRGWAGFIVQMILIYFIRKRSVTLRTLASSVFVFILFIPLLLVVRDIFRPSGQSYYELLVLDGNTGFDLYFQYFSYVLKAILLRLDFYSNYIGVSWMSEEGYDFMSVCNPVQENVFQKIFVKLGFVDECISLGSVIPGYLYDFFLDKGTSFALGGAWIALPELVLFNYGISYLFILLGSVFIFYNLTSNSGLRVFFIYCLFLLLFQGWTYQFTYWLLGIVLGVFLTRIKI